MDGQFQESTGGHNSPRGILDQLASIQPNHTILLEEVLPSHSVREDSIAHQGTYTHHVGERRGTQAKKDSVFGTPEQFSTPVTVGPTSKIVSYQHPGKSKLSMSKRDLFVNTES